MKSRKAFNLVLRIISAPIMLMLFMVSYNLQAVFRWIQFILYGGEVNTYYKDDHASLRNIFEKLKEAELNKTAES